MSKQSSGVPLISFLCATYNGENLFFLHNIDNLIALLDKSGINYEIIISDDCSSDNTWEICKLLKQKHEGKIHLHRQKNNIGVYENYNFMINNSRGKYFAIMDQDDKPVYAFYERAINFLENNNNFCLAHSHSRVVSCQTNNVIRYETCFKMGVGEKPEERFLNTIKNNETLAMAGVIR